LKAFPNHPDAAQLKHLGMDLRDWFAGLAMQGLVAYQGEDFDPIFTAEGAYGMADEMMKARDATNEQI
jgi:hypothetical protein